MSKGPNVRQVLDSLTHEGYLEPADHEQAAAALTAQQNDDTAWYILGIMGCGGWIAAIFLLVFISWLFFEPLLEEPIGAIITGVILAGVTLAARRGVNNIAANQFLLVFHIIGHLFIFFGLLESFPYDSIAPALLMLIPVAVATAFYPDPLVRFLGGLAIVSLLHLTVEQLRIPFGVSVIAMLLAAGITYLWGNFAPARTAIRWRGVVRPASYALVVGLYGTLLWELSVNEDMWNIEGSLTSPVLTSLFILSLTLLVVWRTLGVYDIAPGSVVGAAALGIVLALGVPSLLAPGIMAAVLIIVLGFQNGNRIMIAFGYLTLVGFTGQFYYSLDTTLLLKSLIMILSGIVLLAGWALLRRNAPPAPKKGKIA